MAWSGLTLAKELDAKVDVLHAVDVRQPVWPRLAEPELPGQPSTPMTQVREQLAEMLNEAYRASGIDRGRPEELLHVTRGHPAKVLLHMADQVGADLIVLGPHAKRGLLDFGSTMRAVMSHTKAPLWVQTKAATPIRRILVAVDFSDHSRLA